MLDKLRKSTFLLMIGLVVLTVSPVGAASRPAPSASIGDLAEVAPNVLWADAPLAVLYNQYDNAGGVGVNSQNFEAAYDAYDDFAADDFEVPPDTKWTVSGVNVQGLYFNGPGPAASFNVFMAQDGGGEPGILRATRKRLAYISGGADDFQIIVEPPIVIQPSSIGWHVWISVQANLDFAGGAGGQWGWTDRTVQNNDPAVWKNPRGGFGVCPNWDVLATCLGGQADGPDFVFLVVGTSMP